MQWEDKFGKQFIKEIQGSQRQLERRGCLINLHVLKDMCTDGNSENYFLFFIDKGKIVMLKLKNEEMISEKNIYLYTSCEYIYIMCIL